MAIIDMLGREIKVDDFVVFSNFIYKVLKVTPQRFPDRIRDEHAMIRMILLDKSKTTRAVTKYSREMVILPTEAVYKFILTKMVVVV